MHQSCGTARDHIEILASIPLFLSLNCFPCCLYISRYSGHLSEHRFKSSANNWSWWPGHSCVWYFLLSRNGKTNGGGKKNLGTFFQPVLWQIDMALERWLRNLKSWVTSAGTWYNCQFVLTSLLFTLLFFVASAEKLFLLCANARWTQRFIPCDNRLKFLSSGYCEDLRQWLSDCLQRVVVTCLAGLWMRADSEDLSCWLADISFSFFFFCSVCACVDTIRKTNSRIGQHKGSGNQCSTPPPPTHQQQEDKRASITVNNTCGAAGLLYISQPCSMADTMRDL